MPQSDKDLLASRLDEVREWYRRYKTAEGKGLNEYWRDGQVLSKQESLQVIQHSYEQWQVLVREKETKSAKKKSEKSEL